MKDTKSLFILFIKRFLFFILPILLFVFIFYELIFDINMSQFWPRLLIYIILIGFMSIRQYKHKKVEIPVESLKLINDRISSGRWKVIENEEDSLVLRPKFDFPYNILSRDKVYIKYAERIAIIKGSEYYVDRLVKDVQRKRELWSYRITNIIYFALILIILALPILFEKGIILDLRITYHNYQARDVDAINIEDTNTLGNTVNNINNYGSGVEYNRHIFYVEDHLNLLRTTKDLHNKQYLIKRSGGTGIGSLNIIDDWIFYNSGKTLSRMRIDGSKNETIYKMGYLLDIHVFGSDIYFISATDNFKVYRMNVRGQNLEKFVDIPVSDIAIYDNRLFYSYVYNGEGFLESVDLYGRNKRTEMDVPVKDLIRWDNYYYFIGHDDYKLYRYEIDGGKNPQLLVDNRVSSYIVTEYGIYYSLHSQDVGYPGEGLYKMDLEGNSNTLLADTQRVENLSQVGDYILFMSSDDNVYPSHKRLDLLSDYITVMD